MLLKELPQGKRFMFADRGTPLALATSKGQHTAAGTFQYQAVGENACPKLLHEQTGKVVVPISATYWRAVLPIF